MALLQLQNPVYVPISPAPAGDRHRPGHTNSLVATVRSGSAAVLEDEAGRALLPSVVRYVQVAFRKSVWTRKCARPTIPITHRLGQTLHGPRAQDVPGAAATPYRFVDSPAWCASIRAPAEKPVRCRLKFSGCCAAVLSQPGRRTHGRGHHRAGYFDDAQRQRPRMRAAGRP